MKEITMKKESVKVPDKIRKEVSNIGKRGGNEIVKFFKKTTNRIMSIDLIDGQKRGESIARRFLILILLFLSMYVLLDLLVEKGYLITNEQRQSHLATEQATRGSVIAPERTEEGEGDSQASGDMQGLRLALQPVGKIESYILSYGGRYDVEYLNSLRKYCDEETLKLVIAISVAETGMGKARMDKNTNWYGYFYKGDRQYDPDVDTMSRVICNGIGKYYSDVNVNVSKARAYTGGDNTNVWMVNVNKALERMR